MSKADTWMPLYIADYLRKTMHLTRDQHGGYLMLLMACWDRGGRLPNDAGQLAGIARATPAEWKKLSPVLLPFFEDEGEFLTQGRVVEEHGKAARLSEARRQAGRQGGRPRKQPESTDETKDESERKPIGFPLREKQTETPTRVALPSPSPAESSDPNGSGADAPSDDDELDPLADLRALPVAKGCWRLAVQVLTEQGRVSDPKARTFVGKLKQQGLTDDELWQVAEGAWREQTEDPQAYLVKAAEGVIERRGAGGMFGPSIRDPSPNRQRLWMQDFRDHPRDWRDHERGPPPGCAGCQVSPEVQREFGVEPAAPQVVRGAA